MKKIIPSIFIFCVFLCFNQSYSQTVKQKGACGAIYVRTNEELKKIEIEQLPVVLQSHKTLDRDHLLIFDSIEEIDAFIKLIQNCNESNIESENQRFECTYLKDTKIVAFGHAEDKYTTKDITINLNDIPKLVTALREIEANSKK